jgi:putative membrane protein
MSGLYLWIKALHVVAIIAWMAAMLYLPRLFVYHSAAVAGSESSEAFKVMERRLLKAIMTPAMIVAWATGLWLAWDGGWLRAGWLHGKLLLVVALSGLHGYFAGAVRRFAGDARPLSSTTWRVLNEVPTVAMIAIVVLVIVKPF